MPDFDVTVLTVRSGTHTLRIQAEDANAARALIDKEMREDVCHCPAEWCTDDVQSEIVEVRTIVAAHQPEAIGAQADVPFARNAPGVSEQ